MSDFDPHKAIQYIWDNAPEYAIAKGHLAELEAFKSSLKAILMKESSVSTLAAQEREAYADKRYQTHIQAIGQATKMAEELRWKLICAQMRFDAWRTEQASNRNMDKMTK
jgi:hypothetical protein